MPYIIAMFTFKLMVFRSNCSNLRNYSIDEVMEYYTYINRFINLFIYVHFAILCLSSALLTKNGRSLCSRLVELT